MTIISNKPVLGVIGGLGPEATAYFLQLLVQATEAHCDQEHLHAIIYNWPSIPDRTAYIKGDCREDPLSLMLPIAQELARQQVAAIVIPCITAHYFYPPLAAAVETPVLHLVQETLAYLQKNHITCAGLFATDGTLFSQLFQQAADDNQVQLLFPDPASQRQLMDLIYRIKGGEKPDLVAFRQLAESLFAAGAEVLILGCTELSLLKRDYDLGTGFLDALEVLAVRAIEYCGYPLRPAYRQLLTKRTKC